VKRSFLHFERFHQGLPRICLIALATLELDAQDDFDSIVEATRPPARFFLTASPPSIRWNALIRSSKGNTPVDGLRGVPR
jgi:hypothetical protein